MRRLMALLLLVSPLLAPAARAQSLNSLGITRLNQDVQSLWAHDGVPMALSLASAEAQKLVGVPHAIDSSTTATIVGINSIALDMPIAPGVRRLDAGGADFALPLTGSWNITASVEMNVKGRFLFVGFDQTFSVTIALRNLVAEMSATFDSSDLAAPKVQAIHPPVVHFDLDVSSSNFIVNALGWISGGLVDSVGQVVIKAGAVYLARKLDVMTANTPSVMSAGGPALQPIARGDLEGAVAKLGEEIEQYRTPFGPILEMHFDAPYHGTWGESLRDPSFDPGHADF